MDKRTISDYVELANAAKEKANGATPGPWEIDTFVERDDYSRKWDFYTGYACGPEHEAGSRKEVDASATKDADFIASARSDVPALADAVIALAAYAEKLRVALSVVMDNVDYTDLACGATEMVGAVLPKDVIQLANDAIERPRVTNK